MYYKHIFFDLDRTLWDFETNSDAALRDIYKRFNLAERVETEEAFIKKYKHINSNFWALYRKGKTTKAKLRVDRFTKTLDYFGFDIVNDLERLKIGDYYVANSPKGKVLFPNTHKTLTELKNLGFKLHIITNGFSEAQVIKLAACNLNQYFDVIVCSDQFGKNKPHPTIFKHALAQANAKVEESIMIGDDFNVDVLGAEGIGLRGIHFDPHQEFENRKGITRIEDLEELINIVLGLS